jgi:sulfate permease, SulP family
VFERIRNDIESPAANRVAYIILDFGKVSGVDTSAVMSLAKLRNLCRHQGIPLVYCSLSPRIRAAFERAGFFAGKSPSATFADLNLALAWCEDKLLAAARLDVNMSLAGFESWLQRQLGGTVKPADVITYLERRDTDGSQVLYREGEPSDTLDIVAAGHLKVEIAKGDGESLRVRRIMTHTVVGEMGFYRRKERAATVSSDGPATLFTLTRANYERLRRERPDVARAFDDFIMRILADRVDFANRQAAALQPIGTTPI